MLRPLVMDLLVCLVRRKGEVVSNEELLQEVWKGKVVTQSSVYNSLNELRQALGDDPKNPSYIQTIPKRGYRLIADVVADPQPFSESPGTSLESPTARRTPFSTRKAIALLAILLLLVFLATYSPKQDVGPTIPLSGDPVPQSLAVLPFINESGRRDQRYLSDGLSEELRNRLSRIPHLKVIGSKSVSALRQSDRTPEQTAAMLDVEHLLQGTVRREADRISVVATLLRAEDGQSVWSQEFERGINEFVPLRDAITRDVAEALSLSADQEFNGSLNPGFSSYELYLQARELIHQHTKPSLLGALTKLQKIIEDNPDYAPAHVSLAYVYLQLTEFDGFYTNRQEIFELAEPHLDKALAIDPDLAEAYSIRGKVYFNSWDFHDWDKSEQMLRQAIALDPNQAQAHSWLGWLLVDRLVSWQEPIIHLEKALELEPLWVEGAQWLVAALRHLHHRWDDARAIIENLNASFPDHPTAIYFEAFWKFFHGETAQAITELEALYVLHPDYQWAGYTLSIAWSSLGEITRAESFPILPREWRLPLQTDRQAALEAARAIDTDSARVGNLNFARSAYIYVMFRDWQSVIEILPSHLDDLETFRGRYQSDLGKEDSPALSLATAYRALGDQASFDRWAGIELDALNIRSENGRIRNHQYSRVKARLDALHGDHYQALLELERLVSTGPIDPRDLMHPAFDELRPSPEFREITRIQLDRINEQRALLELTELAADQWPFSAILNED